MPIEHSHLNIIQVKLRMETVNVSKRQQPNKATNGSSMQRETPAPGGVL